MEIVTNFISPEDVKTVQDYIDTIKFNTKEEHDPLHDKLFSQNNQMFDIHTRGEMPDNILEIFSKYSKGYYEKVQSKHDELYHPPMFSKHYIAKYSTGSHSEPHYAHDKPVGTYGSYIVWKNAESGGKIKFPHLNMEFIANPGDLIFFEETKDNAHGITLIESGSMYISEAWMGRKGQLWMENRLSYEEVDWDDWEIKGFYE